MNATTDTTLPTMAATPTVTVVSGGVGAARFLNGLLDAIDPAKVTAVVNTGDDTQLHGLSISPDLDTITYTLADATDPERGWGLRNETWTAMGALERFEGGASRGVSGGNPLVQSGRPRSCDAFLSHGPSS